MNYKICEPPHGTPQSFRDTLPPIEGCLFRHHALGLTPGLHNDIFEKELTVGLTYLMDLPGLDARLWDEPPAGVRAGWLDRLHSGVIASTFTMADEPTDTEIAPKAINARCQEEKARSHSSGITMASRLAHGVQTAMKKTLA